MQNSLTKKNVLIISSFFSLVFLVLLFLVIENLCGIYSRDCKNIFGFTTGFVFPFPIVFLFSLITYKMRDEVFQAWIKIARWWVLASILLVLIMPSDNGPFLPLDKGHVAVLMSVLFTTASIVSILEVTVRLRSKNK